MTGTTSSTCVRSSLATQTVERQKPQIQRTMRVNDREGPGYQSHVNICDRGWICRLDDNLCVRETRPKILFHLKVGATSRIPPLRPQLSTGGALCRAAVRRRLSGLFRERRLARKRCSRPCPRCQSHYQDRLFLSENVQFTAEAGTRSTRFGRLTESICVEIPAQQCKREQLSVLRVSEARCCKLPDRGASTSNQRSRSGAIPSTSGGRPCRVPPTSAKGYHVMALEVPDGGVHGAVNYHKVTL